MDISQIHSYILANREAVLALLGIGLNEPEPKSSEMRKSKTATGNFIYGGTSTVWGGSVNNCTTENESNEALIQPSTVNGDTTRRRQSSFRNSQKRPIRDTSSSNNSSVSSLHLPLPLLTNNDVMASETINYRTRGDHQDSRRHSWRNSNISYRSIGSDTLKRRFENDVQTEEGERCSLISNEVRQTIKAPHIFSRDNHHNPRSNASFRFSAGDADKLEKGIRQIPSTHSLKD